VLRAFGLVVSFAGAALLYGISFRHMGHAARLVTPFGFPAAALAATVVADRVRRPDWEVELAGLIGLLSLGLALLTTGSVSHAGAGYGTVAGLAATLVVMALHRLVGLVRLTSWGLSASMTAFTGFGAATAGLLQDGAQVRWLFVLQAVVALVTGAVLVGRNRDAAAGAWRTAALLAFTGCSFGMAHAGWSQLGSWQAVLTLLVVVTLVASAVFDQSGLMWIGAIGAVEWLIWIGVVVGSSSGWATAVIAFGIGLVGLSVLITQLRRSRHRRGTTTGAIVSLHEYDHSP
jgi:hypothetical protein